MPIVHVVAALLAMHQPQQTAPAQPLAPSPIARIEIMPRTRNIVAGDSIKLQARPLDAAGKPVPGAIIIFTATGGQTEGKVDSTGFVGGSTIGKMPVIVTALTPGTKPVIDSIELHTVPGPAARIDLVTKARKLVAGQQTRFSAIPMSARKDRARARVTWQTSNAAVLTADESGIVTAVAPGTATLTAVAGTARSGVQIEVVANSIASLGVKPSKPAVRQGDVVHFAVDAKDASGKAVAGLAPTWSFSPGDGELDADGNFVAYRPGDYIVTAALGGKAATTVVHVDERNVRRSVTVVGRLPVSAYATSEVWIHPNGKVAYLGTHMGGDRVYAIDITDPANPRIVDSIQANTRLVNDMQTTADGNYMVFTREGAADRKNGIVIADTHDPLHPKEVSQFVDGVAAGVHSVYIYENSQYGKYVFITNDGTGAVDIVNI